MNIYKAYSFTRWAKKERLSDKALHQAITELEAGLHDGDLGAHVFKKRVPKAGQGKRGAYRTIIAVQFEHRAFFMSGYAKNEKAALTPDETDALKTYAHELLNLPSHDIQTLLRLGRLVEVIG